MKQGGRGLFLWRIQIRQAVTCAALLALAACAGGTTGSNIFSTTPEQPRAPDPAFARTVVAYPSRERPGTIVVDPGSHFLYLIQGHGQAIRYGVGVGAEGFVWSGLATMARLVSARGNDGAQAGAARAHG